MTKLLERRFQLVHYGADAATSKGTFSYVTCRESAIYGRAGTLAKRIKGPVDIAVAGPQPWAERYITTAAPSPHHKSGFRLERID